MTRSTPIALLARASVLCAVPVALGLLACSSDTESPGGTPDAGDADAGYDAAPDGEHDLGPDGSDAADVEPDPGRDAASDADVELYLPPTYGEYDPHPEPPAILRDVALIDDDARFTRPFVPGHRTTMDGRIGIRVQGGPPGTQSIRENFSFYLFVPERLQEPIMPGAPGPTIMGDPEPFDVLFPQAVAEGVERTGHHAICDPTEEFAVEGERPNPYPCGPDDLNDCYDIVVVSTTSIGLDSQVWGTPVTVEVENPKTAEARIVDARVGESVAGATIPLNNEWTEPAVTMDGRLFTGRWGRAPRQWTNPNTGETLTRNWDLAYSVLPEEYAPCDVRGWTRFHPISHAPYDPEMVGRYGLAAYPFRDSEGNPIPDGEDMGGTYPWVDREGANAFQAVIQGRMVEQSEEKYPRRCVHEGCERFEENNDWDRGFQVAGLWTHGKLVLLDGMINNQDWAVGVTPAAHYLVELYREPSGEPVEVRLGAGRFIDAVRNAGGPYPPGYTHNANILDSLQNLPNHHRAAMPVTPRDVVWLMSTGVATDEIAFDDFLDVNAFIVSNMQASVTQFLGADGRTLGVPRHWNGEVRELRLPLAVAGFCVLDPDALEEIHVQNAATSLDWNVPAYGRIDAGAARIEPTALGGVTGKGLWLSGDAAVHYAVGAQPREVTERDWYTSLFVDPRGDAGETRVLLSYPDGSEIHLEGSALVRYVRHGRPVHEVALPATEGWVHLGFAVDRANTRVTLLHDGYALDRFEAAEPLFVMSEGEFVVARSHDGFAGFRGWIDDLKVFAYVPDVEVLCNHAMGTLIGVDGVAGWESRAAGYPEWAHAEVAAAAGAEPGAFACYSDHSADFAAHLGNIPAGAVSVRDAILFPEGPLRAGSPRPDSTGNAFCLTCHHVAGRGGLSIAALAYDAETPAEHDRRRQPMQPPRRVFGNIPAGWIPPGAGPGSPSEATQAPPEGVLIDTWLMSR